MKRRIATITDVAERHLCCGCGVCAFAQPDVIRMVDDLETGRRPVVADNSDTTLALQCCPGIALEHPPTHADGVDDSLHSDWGPVLEVWEGHAADEELRYAGSSGGVASALAQFGIQFEELSGAVQIRQRDDVPILNETVISRSREDVLSATGSRYAPASPCDRLGEVVEASSPVAFIGKPCDVAGLDRARQHFSELDASVAVTIAIFCAGAPSTRGTIEMLRRMGVDDWRDAGEIRYRGRGWPGNATVATAERAGADHSLTYNESWGGILERYRPWRCKLCLDHTGEFADLSVGDPWHRPIVPGESGSSLVVVRTERGRRYLDAARAAGAVDLIRVDNGLLAKSQPNLLKTRGAVWGRIWTSRLLGLPAPRYRRMPAAGAFFRHLTLAEQVRSVTGTAKRIVQRRLYRRVPVEAFADPRLDNDAGERVQP